MTALRPEAAPTTLALDGLIGDVLLRTLEPAVAALERLLGPATPSPHEEGEPDGFDGLERHGSLDRLLPSEWLLAADFPDEFIRRYEHRELSHLRLSHRDEQHTPTSLVLFDTGPLQLGQPRVAQLACLVVLGRRAAVAGAEVRWGTLRGPARHVAAAPDTLDRFLAARTFAPAAELPLDAFVDECLVVSPLPGPPFAARQLVLADVGRAVTATLVDRRRGTTTTAIVPMPEPDDAIRLLRDPAGTRAGATGRSTERAPTSNLVFDQHGHKVLARIEDHRLAVYPVPNSANDKPGRVRFVATRPEHGVIAAAGRVKRTVLAVNVVDDGAAVVVTGFGGSVTGPTGTYPVHGGPLPVQTADAPLGRLSWSGGSLGIHLATHELVRERDAYRADAVDGSRRWGSRSGMTATPAGSRWLVAQEGDEWAVEGPLFGLFRRWVASERRQELRAIVLDDDGRGLVAVGRAGAREVLDRAGERVIDAVASDADVYAYRTASGRVVVRSFVTGELRYQVLPT